MPAAATISTPSHSASARFVSRSAVVIGTVVLWALTIDRLDILLAGMRSFGVTLALLVSHPSVAWTMMSAGLTEAWIACAVWPLGLAGFSAAAIVPDQALRLWRPLVWFDGQRLSLPHTTRWNVGAWMLAFFVFVAIEAPILVTTDPLAQGELGTTRLVPPFSATTVAGHLAPEQRAGASSLETLLADDLVTLRIRSAPPDRTGETDHPLFFILGTDSVGRDVLSRVIVGTRVSLMIGILATLGALLLGGTIGFLAGSTGRWSDSVLMWIVDVFLSIPSLFLVITFAFFLGNSVAQLILVLVLSGWMGVARIVRGEVLHVRHREFVLAAQLFGQSTRTIIRRHLLPNILPTVLTAAILQVSDTILAEAALGFLGYGVQPPTPSWGNMLGEAVAHLETAWWMAVFPGLCLMSLLIALHLIADELQRGWKV